MKVIYIDPTFYDLTLFISDMRYLHALIDETVGETPREVHAGFPNVPKIEFYNAINLFSEFALYYKARFSLTLHGLNSMETASYTIGLYGGAPRVLHLYPKEFFDIRDDELQGYFEFLQSAQGRLGI